MSVMGRDFWVDACVLNKKKITLNKGLINDFPLFPRGVARWLGRRIRGGKRLLSLIQDTGLVKFILGLWFVLVVVGIIIF